MLTVKCPQCGRALSVPEEKIGRTGRCTMCKHLFLITVAGESDEDLDFELVHEDVAARPAPPHRSVTASVVDQGNSAGDAVARADRPARKPADGEPDRPRRKRKLRRVYVDSSYPARLGILSIAWALAGWMIAALAPRLAFVPYIEVLHFVFPAVTVGLIVTNLFFAVRDLWRGTHPLRLLLVTGLQIALFTTLFFQLFAHLGADKYHVDGPTSAWKWVAFSLAHALRATDVLDFIEAYSLNIQPIRHDSALVAVFVIAYHVIIDVFFLGVLWDFGRRLRQRIVLDEGLRLLVRRAVAAVFVLWLVVWLLVAFAIRPWSPIDVPLWLLENVLRVVDFADIMESFDLSLHQLPREGLVGTLTFFCRIWIGLAIGLVSGTKKPEKERRVATPPNADALLYWTRQVGILAAMFTGMLVIGILWEAVLGNPVHWLTAAVAEGPEGRTRAALAAVSRMGPAAEEAIPELVEARAHAAAPVQDEITRTLGYLGSAAIEPLSEIALGEAAERAQIAVDSLARIGPETAPEVVKVCSLTPHEAIRERSESVLRRFGPDAVPPLMARADRVNAETYFKWFGELDRNWTLRATDNPTARALQQLPEMLRRLERSSDNAAIKAAFARLKDCGSAARRAAAAALEHIRDRDGEIRSAAQVLLVSIGPSMTPELCRKLKSKEGVIDDAILALLRNPAMWDAAAAKDEMGLSVLLTFLSERAEDLRELAVRTLALAGPAGRPAIPSLVAFLGDPDAAKRKAVRGTLGKIDPDWRNNRHTGQCIPTLLPLLSSLPKDEADEVVSALRELPATAADALVAVLTGDPPRRSWAEEQERARQRRTQAGPNRNKGDTIKQGQEEQRREDETYRTTLREGLKRLGPERVKAVVPALTKLIANLQASYPARYRAVQCLKHVTPDLREVIGSAMTFFGTGEMGLTFLAEAGPEAAVAYLGGLLDTPNSASRHFAVQALRSYGSAARTVLPKLIEQLAQPDMAVRTKAGDARSRALVVETLDAVDKDWSKHPSTSKVLADMMADIQRRPVEDRQSIIQLLGRLGSAARPFVGDLVAQLVADSGRLGNDARKALDQIDSGWREHAAVKDIIPKLVAKVGRDDYTSDRALVQIGAPAVPEIAKGLPGADQEKRNRILAMLATIGKAAKPAVPALVKELGNPGYYVEETKRVLQSLRAIDPEWRSHPGIRELVPGLLADLSRHQAGRFVMVCAALGPVALPELVKQLDAPKPEHRRVVLAALRDIGAEGGSAIPVVTKALADPDAQVRQAAVEALGRIGRGKKDLVAVLAPALIDTNYYVRLNTPGALDAVDPDWKKSPQFNAGRKRILKALSDPDPNIRKVALEVVHRLRPLEGAVPALQDLLKNEKDQRLKQAVQGLLDETVSHK
jgi:HEAT repeat protein